MALAEPPLTCTAPELTLDLAALQPGTPSSDDCFGTARVSPVSPHGNVVGVSCHDCYEVEAGSHEANLDGTLTRLHAAQADGADLLELDVEEAEGTGYVGHDDDGATDGARPRSAPHDRGRRVRRARSRRDPPRVPALVEHLHRVDRLLAADECVEAAP